MLPPTRMGSQETQLGRQLRPRRGARDRCLPNKATKCRVFNNAFTGESWGRTQSGHRLPIFFASGAGLAHHGRLSAELKAGGYNGDMRNGEETAR